MINEKKENEVIKSPKELSKEYYCFVDQFVQSSFEDEKLLGKFYTDYSIAESMVNKLCDCFKKERNSSEIKIIDPFCGDGRLVLLLIEGLLRASKIGGSSLLVSLWDIDQSAVIEAKNSITTFCKKHNLDFVLDSRKADAFVEYSQIQSQFDICVTNPPWAILKPQKLLKKNSREEAMAQYCKLLGEYDNYLKNEFPISQPSSKFGKWGTNLARCGTELALKLVKEDGICGIVSPSSLFNDQVSIDLRSWLFNNYSVVDISYYPAELKLYGSADISSVTVSLLRGNATTSFSISTYKGKDSFGNKEITTRDFDYIKSHGFCIPFKTGIDSLTILRHLKKLQTVEEFCEKKGLHFAREIDETRINAKLLPTGTIEFAKGYMVDRYSFTGGGSFINESLVSVPASSYENKIVWRDVSRDSQLRRVKATLLPPNYICGNSLGVIYGNKENTPSLKVLLAVMNSLVFEYQVRSMLGSNHVSAGIIKKVKVPNVGTDFEIIKMVNRQLAGEDVDNTIDFVIARLYGLSPDEYKIVVDSFNFEEEEKKTLENGYLKHYYAKEGKKIFNHYAASLSELDMQIIKCVPPGGNWKNIPESIPSQRLAQIRESYKAGKGSRSTYYGRLKPEMPSYTINTYFNRPGNGCNIHYNQDRTISQREAARFQSFPDSFEFIGSIGAINDQIGNAVPPLLAYQVAKSIPFKGMFIDLFCGAGGLALGFEWAGWIPVICNDIDKYAVETHKKNLGGESIVGDINSEDVRNKIIDEAMSARATNPTLPLFVLGGPPCQGFSTANTRRGADDIRNWLFKSYIEIVKAINPTGFVFENVRGILNMDGGKFFEMIKKELEECVEEIKVNQVSAASFGVPQRRDRVIILGGDSSLIKNFQMKDVTCVPEKKQLSLFPLPTVIGAEEAIGDLPPIQPGEDGSHKEYRFPAENPYQKLMRGILNPEAYFKAIQQ